MHYTLVTVRRQFIILLLSRVSSATDITDSPIHYNKCAIYTCWPLVRGTSMTTLPLRSLANSSPPLFFILTVSTWNATFLTWYTTSCPKSSVPASAWAASSRSSTPRRFTRKFCDETCGTSTVSEGDFSFLAWHSARFVLAPAWAGPLHPRGSAANSKDCSRELRARRICSGRFRGGSVRGSLSHERCGLRAREALPLRGPDSTAVCSCCCCFIAINLRLLKLENISRQRLFSRSIDIRVPCGRRLGLSEVFGRRSSRTVSSLRLAARAGVGGRLSAARISSIIVEARVLGCPVPAKSLRKLWSAWGELAPARTDGLRTGTLSWGSALAVILIEARSESSGFRRASGDFCRFALRTNSLDLRRCALLSLGIRD